MSSVMMREKKGGEHKIWKGGKVILLLRWSDRLDGAADLSWPYRPYIYLHVYRPSIFIVSMYTHIKNKKKIQKKKLKRETIEIFFFWERCRGSKEGALYFQYLLEDPFFLVLVLSVWPKMFHEGGSARNPPSSAVVVYQVISGEGSEGFLPGPRCETWLETCQSGRKEGWPMVDTLMHTTKVKV